MIRDIPEENKSNATTVLRFLAFSNRPFTVEELADALAVNLSESPKFDPAFRMPRPTEICLYCPKASFKITKPATGLYYACLYGLVSEVESLLSQYVGVNEQGGRQGYPIVAAADKGHTKIVKL
ncbi:Ankyrin-3 [Colletotrichum sp. SAR 10_98]|nr:Ankyrin-3 [Colletotrichum sp. SAR 10_98]